MSNINIREFQPTKTNISTLAAEIASAVLNGESDPIALAVQLAAIEKVCEQARELIKDSVSAELSKHNGKTEILGAKIERKEVGTKYDYTASEAWSTIKAMEDKIAEHRKAVEAIAKALPEGHQAEFVNPETGEAMTIVRSTKSSTTSFAVTLGK
jgi:hypothetical protein